MPARAPTPLSTDALLTWYHAHRRDLPWRPISTRPANPYHVLVSEAMLQQTQVATVLPYYARFIAAFPTVHALAAADEQRVLTLWQGLGYYRRARNLHAAARLIVERHAGRVPDTVADLLALPGVGRYTAGAVASIAYNAPAPILDGNVARVLSRYLGLATPLDQPTTQRALWNEATDLVQRSGHPRDFNQSLMELGALICTPRSAKCLYCPLRDGCNAFATGRVAALPVKPPKKRPLAVTHTIVALKRRGRYLFERRPDTGLWAGMWQMPTVEGGVVEDPRGRVAARLAPQNVVHHFAERYRLAFDAPQLRATFTHATTHRTIRFDLYHAPVTAGRLPAHRAVWRSLRDLADLPLAKPQRVAVGLLLKSAKEPRP